MAKVERLQVYKCEVCGNVVEAVHGGAGQLVCCGKPMKLMVENTVDAAKEKHVPVIDGTRVKVGSVPHPMEAKHYIEWIEVTVPDGAQTVRRFLKPGEKPEAELLLPGQSGRARAFCNLHGLWKSL
jgi:superoxide reductase